jgi:hypothetical protein
MAEGGVPLHLMFIIPTHHHIKINILQMNTNPPPLKGVPACQSPDLLAQ